jgi:hypothetical protein
MKRLGAGFEDHSTGVASLEERLQAFGLNLSPQSDGAVRGTNTDLGFPSSEGGHDER